MRWSPPSTITRRPTATTSRSTTFTRHRGWVVVKVTGRAGADAGAFRIGVREITITD